ncbi:MAG: hypothetical protein HYX34_12235 [Actinobacteria bacterium]|nr:hypothetical protein [Actinomycetota bacterium]
MSHLMLAAISWDPGFRGILVVAVGVLVLCGSVYLLLATNSGPRLGFLLALTALFGWIFLMAIIWSIYGIGKRGPDPKWVVEEVNLGDLRQANLPVARSVPEPDRLPDPAKLLAADPVLQRQFPQGPGLKRPNLGDLLGAKPSIESQLKIGGGWRLLPTSDPQNGEAVATASAYVVDVGKQYQTSTDFVVLEAFTKGGKSRRPQVTCANPFSSGCLKRAWFKIKRIVTWPLGNPTHYGVVQLRGVVPQETIAGQPPPLPVADPSQPVISVVMVRNLGARRLTSVITALVAGLLFAIGCLTLHRRDKRVAQARAALATA